MVATRVLVDARSPAEFGGQDYDGIFQFSAAFEIVDYLDCAMVQQDGCMAEYDAKEKSRREKTKGAIEIQ